VRRSLPFFSSSSLQLASPYHRSSNCRRSHPAFPITQVPGFAVLEIDATHLTITFFNHAGKQIGGPYTSVKK
jgi:hypothetical protein